MDLRSVSAMKLNNSNYESWKLRTEALLIREGLWTYVKNDPPAPAAGAAAGAGEAANAVPNAVWLEGDEKARATILLLLEENQYGVIRGIRTAKAVWAALAKHHQKATLSTRVSLLQRMCETRYHEGEDMDAYLNKMEDLYTKLCSAGKDLGEDTMVAFVLRGLPKSFNALTTALETRSDDALTLNLVREKLLDEVSKQNRDLSSGTALKGNVNRKVIVCHNCKRPGHKQRDCRWKQEPKAEKKQNAKTARNDQGEMYALTIGGGRGSAEWIIDSGASSHMTSNREFFDEMEPATGNVELADGRNLAIEGSGSGVITCNDGNGNYNTIRLNGVMYVPKLAANLLSVPVLTTRKAELKFEEARCLILINDKVIAEAVMSRGLYRVKHRSHQVCAANDKVHRGDCQHTWHRRFGHRDTEALSEILRKNLVDGMKVTDCGIREGCECCVKGKQARTPFPKASESKTTAPLDLMHSDVYGPLEVKSVSGSRYILTLVDDYSRYCTIFLLKSKSEVADKIVEFSALVKTQFGRYPKRIRSDRGGEYTSDRLMTYYRERGIHAEFTAGYSPQQNGVAERRNRYIIEMCRCMLIDSDLPSRYWAEAASTAVYLQNRSPTRTISMTPYEAWWGRKPDVKHLRVFGCKAFVLIPKEKRRKLDEKSKQMTFVGYSSNHKAYRFVDVSTNQLVISRDARFVEEEQIQVCDTIPILEETVEEVLQPLLPLNQQPTVNQPIEAESDDEDSDEDDGFDTCEEGSSSATNATGVAGATRRSERSNKGVPPERYQTSSHLVSSVEPRSYDEAVSSTESELWKTAMDEEFMSLMQNSTWEYTTLPEGKKAIGCKWLYKRKLDENGQVSRYKARLVVQGFKQQFGIDYDQVFAPVARHVTFRMLLTVAARRNMIVKHVDFKNAYLNGVLSENVFMKQPKGYETGNSDTVCHLKRSLYGLKQAGHVWNKTIDKYFKLLGFVQSTSDPCLYIKIDEANGQQQSFILLYVDDMLIVCNTEEEYEAIMASLSTKFVVSPLGDVRHYLGIQVTRCADGRFVINQGSYIQRLAERFGLEKAKPSAIPMEPGYLRAKEEESNQLPNNNSYLSLIGGLLYVAVNTRPDISISTSLLGRKVSSPTSEDWTEAKRVMRYLVTTAKHGLHLGNDDSSLTAYVDADWAGDHRDRKSNTGFLIFFGGGAISWGAKKQTCVALSSSEAEFIAVAEASQELLWIRKMMLDFREPDIITLYEDNQSTIQQLQSDKLEKRSKHVDTKFEFVKDLVKKKIITVIYCPTETMIADMLTKPLQKGKLATHRTNAGVKPGSLEEEC